MIPFFFLKIRKDGDYHVFNPVNNRDYMVSYNEYRILELCDGTNTLDEITGIMEKDLGMCKTEAAGYVDVFLDKMYKVGMIAWREGKLNYEINYPPPSAVYWDITGRCNLRCIHCYYPGCESRETELSTGEIKRVLEEISVLGVNWVIFSGGEPLLRKDFLEVAGHARGLGFRSVSLATNGTLIDRDIAKQLRVLNLDVQVSIDGDTAELHDMMRGVKGAFDQAVRGIKFLQDEGMEVSVCTVATKLNVDRVPHIMRLMRDLNVRNYRVQVVMPLGRGQINAEKLRISPGRIKRLVEYLESENITVSSYGFTLKSPPEEPVDFCQTGACAAATSKCSITPDGTVIPCTPFWGMNGENLRDHTFKWIWENSAILNYFRSMLLKDIRGVCRDCKWLLLCGGGCKADNYLNGDVFGSNLICWVADEMKQSTLKG